MKIIDLKLQLIQEETSMALDYYPKNYQKAFAIPKLRQKLVLNVYNNIPGFYSVIICGKTRLPIKHSFAKSSQELCLQIETEINRQIKKISEEYQDLMA